MATACPNNNCIALARWPMSDPAENLVGQGGTKSRKRADDEAQESFAVVASPTVMSDQEPPYNRIILAVTARTDGRVLKAYRAQLENAVKTIDSAIKNGQAVVEVLVKVPEDLTRPRKAPETNGVAAPKPKKAKKAKKEKK